MTKLMHYWSNKLLLMRVIAVTTIALMFVFISWSYQWTNFNSDSAVKVLLGYEMYETKQFFPSSWIYYNGDLPIFFGNVVVAVLAYFFDIGFGVHAISGAIFGIMLLFATDLVLRAIGISRCRRWFGLALIGSGISLPLTEQIWAQTGNGTIYFWMCIFLYLIIRTLIAPATKKNIQLCFIGLYFSLVITVWSNPSRAFFFYILPIIVVILFLFYRSRGIQDQKINNLKKTLVVSVAGFLTGYVAREITLGHISMDMGYAGQLKLSTLDGVISSASSLPARVLALLGGAPTPCLIREEGVSFHDSLRNSLGVGSVLLVAYYLSKQIIKKNSVSYFISMFILVSTCQVFIVIAFTSLSHINYYSPILTLTIVILFATNLGNNNSRTELLFGTTLVALILMNSIWINYAPSWRKIHKCDPIVTSFGDFQNPYELINFLENNRLHLGYSTFWRAGRLTVLGNGRSAIRSVIIDNGALRPDNHMVSKRWYIGDKGNINTFLIVDQIEEQSIDWNRLSDMGAEIKKILQFGRLRVYVFQQDLGTYLR